MVKVCMTIFWTPGLENKTDKMKLISYCDFVSWKFTLCPSETSLEHLEPSQTSAIGLLYRYLFPQKSFITDVRLSSKYASLHTLECKIQHSK